MWPFSSSSSSSSTSSSITDRLEALRTAEGKLLEYAKTRFAGRDDDTSHCRSFELFDSPIDIPSVIRRNSDGRVAMVAEDSGRQQHDQHHPHHLTLHGVKVTNARLSNHDQSSSTVPPPPPPLVLLHGYANGSLYFYRNLMGLSRHFGSVYALDMLGWGLSSRPKFHLTSPVSLQCWGKTVTNDDEVRVQNAESFFVESLESWRVQHNLTKMTLAGHSMGGYLATAYAERHPDRVHKLILLSPVGVPEPPSHTEQAKMMKSQPFYVRTMFSMVRYLFESRGVTPGDFLRSLPSTRSRDIVESYIHRRLPALTCGDERKVLGEYLYQNSMLPGSGEYCLGDILTSGAHARVPLIDRIPNLVGHDDNLSNDGLEIHSIYGERDWMDYRGGVECQRICEARRAEWEAAGCVGKPPPKVYVHGIKDAGHLLMLDNYEDFNDAVLLAAGVGGGGGDTNNRSTMVRGDGSNLYLNELGAASFFRGPQWRPTNDKSEREESEEGGGGKQ